MSAQDEKDKKIKLIKIIRQAIENDNNLRDKYQMGEKFRFVRDRLHSLLERLEKQAQMEKEEKKVVKGLAEGEMLVYVYLYNAQGTLLKNWQSMVTASVFYEYSVNRPIYADKAHVENLIKTKSNKAHHGYLTVIITRSNITQPISDISPKDINGNPLLKIKEGTLQFEKLVAFTHNHADYIVNEDGELVRKVI